MTMFRIYTLSGAVVIAVAGSLMFLGGPQENSDKYGMLRRQRISAQGRITDGTVLDVQEFDSDTATPRRWSTTPMTWPGCNTSAPRT